jgi:hypothetical protein
MDVSANKGVGGDEFGARRDALVTGGRDVLVSGRGDALVTSRRDVLVSGGREGW